MGTGSRILARSDREAARTLDRMAALAYAAVQDPSVLTAARRIVARVDGRDEKGQAREIRAYLSRGLRFTRDPYRMELLTEPAVHLSNIGRDGYTQGDCDDAATLGAALAMAVGLPVELHAVAFDRAGAPYSHVITMVRVRDRERRKLIHVDLDTTAQGVNLKPRIRRVMVRRL